MFEKIILVILLITSCEYLDEEDLQNNNAYVCHTNNHKRTCNESEKVFIDNMKAILAQLRSFSNNNWKNFYKKEQNLPGRKVYFFGENHNHAIAQMENLAAINQLSNSNANILLEGNSSSLKPIRECGMNLVFKIYQAWQWEKQGQPYDSKQRSQWLKSQNFSQLYYSTYHSFYIKDLNLHKMTCYFWDDAEALKSAVNYQSLIIRNKSMTESIKRHINNDINSSLIVITGLGHMPLGEYLLHSNTNKSIYEQYSINNFYKNISKYANYGTSFVVYDFLFKNAVNYIELIHKSFLNY